jgi:hypothetical protein
MTFTTTPQTIWEGDEYGDGQIRCIRAQSSNANDLWLERLVLDNGKWLQIMGGLPIRNREQAIAVRMAIDTYLETPPAPKPSWSLRQAADRLVDHSRTYPHYGSTWGRQLIEEADRVAALIDGVVEPIEPPPALQQTGIEMAKEAWAVLQAANRLVGYCRSVRIDTKAPFNPDEEPKCWQMEGWCLGLLEDADRVAALIDGVVEPIGPVPPRGGNPVAWDAKHIAGPDIDLIVQPSETATTTDRTVWGISDEFGEEIFVDVAGLAWLAELLPRVVSSYRSHSAAMEGGSNDS